jgi:hypothetical protein
MLQVVRTCGTRAAEWETLPFYFYKLVKPITFMPLMTFDGWIDDFDYFRAEFNKGKDLFGFPYAEIDGIKGFWLKESERKRLTWEQIEAMASI